MLQICKEGIVNKPAGKGVKGVVAKGGSKRRGGPATGGKEAITRKPPTASPNPSPVEFSRDPQPQNPMNEPSATADSIWSAAQQMLRNRLNSDIYNLWFAPIRACDLQDESITLLVANDFCEVWLKDNYLDILQ